MQSFRIYVTNITQALSVLQQANIHARNAGNCVEIHINPQDQVKTISLLNSASVVIYDIEAV